MGLRSAAVRRRQILAHCRQYAGQLDASSTDVEYPSGEVVRLKRSNTQTCERVMGWTLHELEKMELGMANNKDFDLPRWRSFAERYLVERASMFEPGKEAFGARQIMR